MALRVDASGQISFKEARQSRRITSIHGWTSAFFVFCAIYLRAHPSRTQELLKYGYLVREAASKFGGWGWRDYDVQFRLRQRFHPQNSWAIIDGELWSIFVAVPNSVPNAEGSFRSNNSRGSNSGTGRGRGSQAKGGQKGGQGQKVRRTPIRAFALPLTKARAPALPETSVISVLHAKGKVTGPPTVPVGKCVAIYPKPMVHGKPGRLFNPIPIKVAELNCFLDMYPNQATATRIREGFSNGFKLGFEGVRGPGEALNLKSVLKDPATVRKKLLKEISNGRMAGPFASTPIANLFVSPIGLVPKAECGKFRLIHHLSHPEGGSVNDGINRDMCTVRYAKFDDAVNLVVRAGKGAHLAKADIESA
jgi:hypothetical protein